MTEEEKNDMPLVPIAVILEVPTKSIRTWARHGNWVSRKQDLLDTAMKASEQKMQELIIKERQPTIERHLRVASKVEQAIEDTVDDLTGEDEEGNKKIAKPRDLKTMAEALASSTGVSGRAVGVGEEGVGNDGKGRKMPVVIVNVQPTLSK
jgi:hypothetical protein